MTALRAAGILALCLSVGSLLALAAASRTGGNSVGPVSSRVRCYAGGDQVIVVASSEEIEVREAEGIRLFVGATVPQAFVAYPQPRNVTVAYPPAGPGAPPLPAPPTQRPQFSGGELMVLRADEGRAIGLPLAVLSGDPVELAQRVEELASGRSQLESPRWASGSYLTGSVGIPEAGRWYAVVVAVARADSPIPADSTVDCDVFMDLEARVYPGPSQALRSAYLAAAGALLILLDRVRSRREGWSPPS